MSRQVFRFDRPQRFVAGTVGEPDDRTFYLQATDRGRVATVLLEEGQVSLLAQKLDELLAEVARRHPEVAPQVEAAGAGDIADLGPLQLPISEEFRVGALGLGWDPNSSEVVVEAHAEGGNDVPDIEDDSDAGAPPVLRVRVTASAARQFARRAAALVSGGRVPCPFCHLPLDPEGHICPRSNGYLR